MLVKHIILWLLLLVTPLAADPITTGLFIEQPVIYQGCHTCGFYGAGTILESVNGLRALLVDRRSTEGVTSTHPGDWFNWTFIPYPYQWVTKASGWAWDGSIVLGGLDDWLSVSASDWAYSQALLPYINVTLDETSLLVKFYGYEIGLGTVTSQVPEPPPLALLSLGIAMLIFKRVFVR